MRDPMITAPAYTDDADFLLRIASNLTLDEHRIKLIGGDYDLVAEKSTLMSEHLRPAAVLMGVIERANGLHLILTRRTLSMPTHAGQIALPGGGRHADDASLAECALREAHEEIGLSPDRAQLAGSFGAFETVSQFRLTPVVAIVKSDFQPKLDAREVAAIFEVPIAFLMNRANHHIHHREWNGARRYYFAMPYGEHYIWGATARVIKGLCDHLYRASPDAGTAI